MASSKLLQPLQLGKLLLPNRVLMAPLTRNRADIDNIPTEMMRVHYTQRASAGLIIAEATGVNTYSQGYPLTPGVFTQKQVAGWKQVTESVKAAGGRIFLQLWHCGRVSHSSYQPDGRVPLSASTVKMGTGQAMTMSGMQEYEVPREASLEEIATTVQDFKQAAINAIEAGFHGVELHAANGYLIDQFLRDSTNKRTDGYGGSIENRYRFLREILQAVTSVVPSDQVGVRLTPGGTFNDMSDSNTLPHFSYIIEQLNSFNLAYLHIKESDDQDLRHGGEIIPIKTWRGIYKGVLLTNTNYDQAKGEAIVSSGSADAVTYGRPFIVNPDLPLRFAQGAHVKGPDTYDWGTFFGGSEKGYTDYPSLQQESEVLKDTEQATPIAVQA